MRTRATPWDRDRATPLSGAIRCHMTPLFWGGSLSSFSLFRVVSVSGRFNVHKHNRMKEIEESGSAAFLDLAMPYPPL